MEGPATILTYDELCMLHADLTQNISALESEMVDHGIEYDSDGLWQIANECWDRIHASISCHEKETPHPEFLKTPDFLIIDLLPKLGNENKRINACRAAIRITAQKNLSWQTPSSSRPGISEDRHR